MFFSSLCVFGLACVFLSISTHPTEPDELCVLESCVYISSKNIIINIIAINIVIIITIIIIIIIVQVHPLVAARED